MLTSSCVHWSVRLNRTYFLVTDIYLDIFITIWLHQIIFSKCENFPYFVNPPSPAPHTPHHTTPHHHHTHTGKGGAVHLFVVHGCQETEEDTGQLRLTDKLLQAVLAEAQVVCIGQHLLIVGDLNAEFAVILCLAECISAGEFVDLALAYSLGAGVQSDATCKFKRWDCVGSRRDFIVGLLCSKFLLLKIRSPCKNWSPSWTLSSNVTHSWRRNLSRVINAIWRMLLGGLGNHCASGGT